VEEARQYSSVAPVHHLRQWWRSARYFTAAVLVMGIFVFLADARTRRVIFDPRGQITQGEVFGVGVGDSAESSIAALRRAGFTRITISRQPPYFVNAVVGDEFIYGYTFDWRHGVACLMIKNGKVQAVAWDYNMLNP